MDVSDPETTPRPTASRRRRRKWPRRLGAVLIVLVLAWVVLTHSRVTRWLVIPRVERLVNARIQGGEVSVGLFGEVRVTDAVLRAPGVDGQAGAIIEVRRLRARPNWGRLLGVGSASDPMVWSVEIVEPVVRISQSVDDNRLNIAAIDLPSPQGPAAAVPSIVVRRGTLELGEHRRDTDGTTAYTPLKRIDIDGEFHPSPNIRKGVYELALTQIQTAREGGGGPSTPPTLFDLRGTVGEGGVSLSLRGLSLDDWPASSVPTPVREIFSLLDLQGRVQRTDFEYDAEGGVRALIRLDDVAVNLPLKPTDTVLEGPVLPSTSYMRMSRVSGWIRLEKNGVSGDLNGMLEDLPYHVKVQYDGTRADSAFVCEFECQNFRLDEKPQILRFAPPMVKYRLATFSNPTAVVTARARAVRGPAVDGKPAPVSVSGTLEFREGVAAYERFPYQFRNMTGTVVFDENTIDIVHLEGVSPAGAHITASAHISPLTDDAKVDVKVEVTGVPVDAALEEAMGTRRKLVQEICSDAQHRRLLDDRVILTPEDAEKVERELAQLRGEYASASLARALELEPRLSELERLTQVPVFVPRGRADVSIRVQREQGWESVWTELIEVRLGTIGVLPDRFPLPVIAEGVRVVIDGETVKVEGGTYRALSGGEATVSASMLYPTMENPDLDPKPQVSIQAKGIPADDRLVAAVGGAIARSGRDRRPDPGEGGESSDRWTERVLRRLGLHGTVDAVAEVRDSEFGTELHALTRLEELTSTPDRSSDQTRLFRPLIDRISGTVEVTNSAVAIDLSGRFGGPEADSIAQIDAQVSLQGPSPEFMGPPAPTSWAVLVEAPRFDVSARVDPVLALFSPAAGEQVERLRAQYLPTGLADLNVSVSGGPAGTTSRVEAGRIDGVAFDLLGGRLALGDTQGMARVVQRHDEPGVSLEFEGFRGLGVFDDERIGTVTLDGRLRGVGADAGDPSGPSATAGRGELVIGLVGGQFESFLVRSLVDQHASDGIRSFVEESRPVGEFDAWINPRRTRDGTWEVNGEVSPHSLAVTLDGGRASFETMSGSVQFEGKTSGTFHDLAAQSEGDGTPWSVVADGSWLVQKSGEVAVRADLRGESTGLPPSLLAVLPPEATKVFRELSLNVAGRITMPRGVLRIDDPGTGESRSVRFEGQVEIEKTAMDLGLAVTDAAGVIEFDVDRPTGGATGYEIRSRLDSCRVANVALTQVRVRVVGDGPTGTVMVPLISADCYGGRLAGSMRMSPRATADENAPRDFETSVRLSGVRFAPVLKDLGAGGDDETDDAKDAALTPEPGEPPEPGESADGSRGIMDANVSLAGQVGEISTRRGRGSFVVGGGSVIRLPLVLQMIQVSNLQLPSSEALNLATGRFYIDGPTVAFEDMSVFSDSVQIYGYGLVTMPEMNLNMRFNSRSLRRIPLVSWLVEGIRDQLIGTMVTGTVKDPDVSTVPLAGTADTLNSIFGTSDEQATRMAEIEKRAARERDRVRTAGSRGAREPE